MQKLLLALLLAVTLALALNGRQAGAGPVGQTLTKKLSARGLPTSALAPIITNSGGTPLGGVRPSLGAVLYRAKFVISSGATNSVVGYTVAADANGTDQRFVPLNSTGGALIAGGGAYEFEFSATDSNYYNLYTASATTLDEITLVEVAQ